jgi:hypothetical protein
MFPKVRLGYCHSYCQTGLVRVDEVQLGTSLSDDTECNGGAPPLQNPSGTATTAAVAKSSPKRPNPASGAATVMATCSSGPMTIARKESILGKSQRIRPIRIYAANSSRGDPGREPPQSTSLNHC